MIRKRHQFVTSNGDSGSQWSYFDVMEFCVKGLGAKRKQTKCVGRGMLKFEEDIGKLPILDLKVWLPI